VGVATASASTGGGHEFVTGTGKVGDKNTIIVVDDGPRWDQYDAITPSGTVLPLVRTVPAALPPYVRMIA
jgi:hypothetical protein